MIPADNFPSSNTITTAVAIYKENWQKYLKLFFKLNHEKENFYCNKFLI